MLFNGEKPPRAPSAAVDTGTPVTLVQVEGDGSTHTGELRLQHGTHPSKSRFVFYDFEVHDVALAPLGFDTPFAVGGIVGASLLSNFSVQLIYAPTPTLTLSDQVPDAKWELADDCDPSKLLDPATASAERCQGVFDTPKVGGGLAQISGALVELPATRLVLPLCLMPAEFDPSKPRGHGAESTTGVPAVGVVATGLGASVISQSALKRLQAKDPTLTATGGATLYLPDGAVQTSRVTLPRAAVVSSETDVLGPCAELALRRRLLIADRVPLDDADRKLLDEKWVNGASTALLTSGVEFAVLADEAPLLQGLRQELGPAVADIDVVLGGSFLRSFDLQIDYPASRIIMRCGHGAPADGCQVLPWCAHDQEGDPRCPIPEG